MYRVGIVLFLLSFNMNLVRAEASQRNIALLASSCVSCHSIHLNKQAGLPSLSGLAPEYFMKQMTDFANLERSSTVMFTYATAYSQEEIKALALYFSSK